MIAVVVLFVLTKGILINGTPKNRTTNSTTAQDKKSAKSGRRAKNFGLVIKRVIYHISSAAPNYLWQA